MFGLMLFVMYDFFEVFSLVFIFYFEIICIFFWGMVIMLEEGFCYWINCIVVKLG